MNISVSLKEDRLGLAGLETIGLDDTSYPDELFFQMRSTVAPPKICPGCGASRDVIHRHGRDVSRFKDVVGWGKMVSLLVERDGTAQNARRRGSRRSRPSMRAE